ncbi:TIGR04100 family radical SAM protein [Mediterraneibacter sp. NSJ-55]|uniref:TIGR04100 family radical SAM protein n=1 Tax=Mediterraneibacter hominis TaxID=2763054 RepID=A0A923RQU5_9FIRM|nr:TIGR04100 family radical SAM protein [Mediterraneibacter hominis]MBC5689910.1 TIGR04100 family radical SAM protein [Mediterraneibacter hominis]
MADILYTYKENVYVNLTNKCDCSCKFCIRSHQNKVGDADTLWHKADPSLEDVITAIDAFHFDGYKGLVYCGYGEPTCALENLLKSAQYAKKKYGLKIRVNTNGLANLYYGRNIVPELAKTVDCVSISLNAPDKEKYMEVTRPKFENAFEGMLEFAEECKKYVPEVKFTVVDVLSEEEIQKSKELAENIGIDLRIRRFV